MWRVTFLLGWLLSRGHYWSFMGTFSPIGAEISFARFLLKNPHYEKNKINSLMDWDVVRIPEIMRSLMAIREMVSCNAVTQAALQMNEVLSHYEGVSQIRWSHFRVRGLFLDEEVNINFTSRFISKFPFTLIDRSTAIADNDLLERFTFNLSTLPADWQAYFISSYHKTFPCNNIQ